MKIQAALAIFAATLLTTVCATKLASEPGGSGSSDDAWSDVTAWMQQHGATVNSKAAERLTRHGSALIRGIVATGAIASNELLLSIPKPLWMTHDNFEVPQLSELRCEHAKHNRIAIQAAVAVALEQKKGTESRWHAYLKKLPTLENYQSFYIHMASPELLQQFHALPLVREVEKGQEAFDGLETCFNEWNQTFGHVGLSWQDVKHGLAIWYTRNYGIAGFQALIPASYLLNTETAGRLNTNWGSSSISNELHFQLHSSKAIAAGEELYDSYCPGCDNSEFLQGWSLYLDENNKVIELNINNLDASENSNLKAAVQSSLNTPHLGLTAPRCKQAVLDEPQGPIKCAFARLAWEQYGKGWGLKMNPPSMVSEDGLKLKPSDVPSSAAHLLMNSRGMVAPHI